MYTCVPRRPRLAKEPLKTIKGESCWLLHSASKGRDEQPGTKGNGGKKEKFAETRLASLVSFICIEHCFCFSWSSRPSLNNFFDRPRQEDCLLALTVVTCSDFATHHRSHFDSPPHPPPSFVHFREDYFWFLITSQAWKGCSTSLLGQVWISNWCQLGPDARWDHTRTTRAPSKCPACLPKEVRVCVDRGWCHHKLKFIYFFFFHDGKILF